MALHDVIFQSLMGSSRGSMVLHLYKYHVFVLYPHSSRSVNNSWSEIRATQSVLTLMTCFLFSYLADFIFSKFGRSSTVTRDSTTLNIFTMFHHHQKLTQSFCAVPNRISITNKHYSTHWVLILKSSLSISYLYTIQ